MWARVSTFWTRVGRRLYPSWAGSGGVSRGRGGLPSRCASTAVSSPATYPAALRASVTRRRGLRGPRSASAADSVGCASAGAAMITSRAPTARPADSTPSSTRCGTRVKSVRSFALIGSPSVPFTTSTGRAPAATVASLIAAGKPAPPRPRRPACSTSAMSSGPCSGREPCVARCRLREMGPEPVSPSISRAVIGKSSGSTCACRPAGRPACRPWRPSRWPAGPTAARCPGR